MTENTLRQWGFSLRHAGVPLLLAALGMSALACFMSLPSLLDVKPADLRNITWGHAFHPEKLCGQSGSSSGSSRRGTGSSSSSAGSSFSIVGPGCSETNEPKLMNMRVAMPSGLQLLSVDADLAHLQQLLAAAVAEGWPLPLARNLARVLLAHFNAQPGTFDAKQAPVHAKNSGSRAGYEFLASAFSHIAERGNSQFVACSFDRSLPLAFNNRFLFSVSLAPHAAANALPNMLLQLLHVALLLEPGLAYVSIHAAAPAGEASSNELLAWLDLLQLLLVPLGVPLQLAVDTAAHSADHYNSVGFAALGRNAAVAPFFPRQQAAPAAAAPAASSSTANNSQQHAISKPPPASVSSTGRRRRTACHLASSPGSSSFASSSSTNASASIRFGSCPANRPGPGCYKPEQVVFVEPLFFCAGDVVRLMQYPADLACGVQLAAAGRPGGAAAAPGVQLRQQQAARHLLHSRASRRHRRLHWQQQQQQQTTLVVGSQSPFATAAVLQSDVPPEFAVKAVHSVYDATRDITGGLLSMQPPYLLHGPSAYAARAGLPFPVYCCWGGLAKVRGAAFAAGVRFRTALQGECSTTERSLLCDDLARVGFNRSMLDPGVRTSAQLHTKRLFEQRRFPFFYYTQWETTSWFDVQPSLALPYWGAAGGRSNGITAGDSSPGAGDRRSSGGGDVITRSVGSGNSSNSSISAFEGDDVVLIGPWEFGSHHMCCQVRLAAGVRPSSSECHKVINQGETNFTAQFLQNCSQRQGSGVQLCD